MTAVPVVDLEPLLNGHEIDRVAAEIDHACRTVGFFAVINHGIDRALCTRVDALAREFFALPSSVKEHVAMVHGGTAWRGWFPLGGELTSGAPDQKEGYYFGRELGTDDPRVRARVPLHGPNLWPAQPAELHVVLIEYLDRLERLGQQLTRAISVALGLGPSRLSDQWFRDPVTLLRIFRYPRRASDAADAPGFGVGEHTDYGFLTMLWQDASGGLEVRVDDGWIEVPPDPNAFVCNIGDMLDRLTSGRYRSTAHRVKSPVTRDRISVPFFFDPDWDAPIAALPLRDEQPMDDSARRWDRANVHAVEGTYGEYLLSKVAKVFPSLHAAVIEPGDAEESTTSS